MRLFWYSIFLVIVFLPRCVLADTAADLEPNAAGNPGVEVVASGSPEYLMKWLGSLPAHGASVERINVVKPDQLVVVSFLLSGMSADAEGNYLFTLSMYLAGPEGQQVLGDDNYARGSGKLLEEAAFIVAGSVLELTLEESDPEGEYRIVAQVIDLVSGKKSESSYPVWLIKGK